MYKCVYCQFESNYKNGIASHLSQVEKLQGEELKLLKFKIIHPTVDIEKLIIVYLAGDECISSIYHKFGVNLERLLSLRKIKRSVKEDHATAGYKKRYEDGCIKNLGVTNPSKLKSVKDKKKETNLKNFGKASIFQVSSVRQKGVAAYLKNIEHIKLQVQAGMMKKHGVLNCAQIPSARLKNSKSQKRNNAKKPLEERRHMTAAARKVLTEKAHWGI